MYTKRPSNPRAWCAAALVLMLGAFAGNALADPPDRVARVSYLRGSVSFQPAGDDQWAEASLNRPLGTGDKVYTDRDGRAELEIGSADIRLDQSSTFNLLNLDDTTAQLELTGGVMNLHVRRVGSGQSYEVDTPTLAFVVNQPGNYRIDIDPQGNSTMISVFDGAGDVYGENNASYSVRAGSSYRFNDSSLRDYETLDLPRADDFDQFVSTRNARYERSPSRSYVSEDTIGYADLDDNGSWSDEPEYGHVWYPTTVAADWAPYRSGNWSWIDPWGWSWVDNSAWGFAPFHYGRWAYVGNRWGWCPGRRDSVAIYAPALVGFMGGGGWGTSISIGIGGGGPVGWFPLGPRDVYVPWYQTSRGYFNNVNVNNTTIINNTNITNVYNNYAAGRPINANYAYRANAAAVTAVSREAFVGARPVAASRVQIGAAQLRSAQVVSRVGIAPTRASFVAANARKGAAPPAAALNRQVIARTAPPARPVPIATRVQAIQRNNAQPLARSQLRNLAVPAAAAGAVAGAAVASRVQVVGRNAAKPQPLPARGNAAPNRAGPASERANPAVAGRPMPANPAVGARPAQGNERNAAGKAPMNATGNATRTTPNAPGREALPSSRFAPHGAARSAAQNRVAPSPSAAQDRARQTPAERAAPATRNNASAAADRSSPAARSVPSERFAPRNQAAPASRAVERQHPTTPQERAAPQVQRNAPVQTQRATPRNAPAQPQQRYQQPTKAPQSQQRYEQPRSAPQPQRAAPAPRVQPQPQQRAAPPPRVQPQPQQRAQPQERRAAPHADDKKNKDKDNGGG